jgi:hypothetical protein
MPEILEAKDLQMDTDQVDQPISIAEAGKRLMRSASWVKTAKNDLKEIWWWCLDELFNPDGSFTPRGFQKLEELFKCTGNSEVKLRRGKPVSVTKSPEMSRDDYRKLIWTSHQKFPPDKASSYLEEMVDDPDSSQGSEIELLETEIEYLDRGSEMAEGFALVRQEGQRSIAQNSQNMRLTLGDFKGFIKQGIKQTIVSAAIEGVNEGMAEVKELLSEQMPDEVPPPKVKRTSKKSG